MGLERIPPRPPPEWYQNEPAWTASDATYVDAFWRLSTCRIVGAGVLGEIPDDKIAGFADRELELEGDLRECFIYVIHEMDVAYLKWQIAEHKRRNPGRDNGSGGGYDRGQPEGQTR
jgi:hypothetical protein